MDYSIICYMKNNTIKYNIKALKDFKGEKIIFYNRECENIDELDIENFKMISGNNILEIVASCKYEYVLFISSDTYILKTPKLDDLIENQKLFRCQKVNIFLKSVCIKILERYKIKDDTIDYYYEYIKNKNVYKDKELCQKIETIYDIMTYDKKSIFNSNLFFFSIEEKINKLFITEILNDIYDNNKKYSLISCILVSNDEKFLTESIENFKMQTYLNKELIIITNLNQDLSIHINSFNHYQVKCYYSNLTNYEELYNYALEKIKGNYVCQWNKTDNYHPFFLSIIYRYLVKTKFRGVFLSKVVIIHPEKGYFRILSKEFFDRTFLIERGILPKYRKPFIKYDDIIKKEDITIIEDNDFFILYNFNIHNLTLTKKEIKNIFTNTKKIFENEKGNITKIKTICSNNKCEEFNIKEEKYFNKFMNTDYVVLLIIIFVAVIKLIFYVLGD